MEPVGQGLFKPAKTAPDIKDIMDFIKINKPLGNLADIFVVL